MTLRQWMPTSLVLSLAPPPRHRQSAWRSIWPSLHAAVGQVISLQLAFVGEAILCSWFTAPAHLDPMCMLLARN
eukprot:938845-Karenia_brevis.AAC.1